MKHTSSPRQAYLYVIYHPDYPFQSKIGLAKDPRRRLNAANTWSPTARFRLSGAVNFSDAQRAEKVAHKLLHEYRSRGEWFKLKPKQALSFLRGLKRRETNRMRNS